MEHRIASHRNSDEMNHSILISQLRIPHKGESWAVDKVNNFHWTIFFRSTTKRKMDKNPRAVRWMWWWWEEGFNNIFCGKLEKSATTQSIFAVRGFAMTDLSNVFTVHSNWRLAQDGTSLIPRLLLPTFNSLVILNGSIFFDVFVTEKKKINKRENFFECGVCIHCCVAGVYVSEPENIIISFYNRIF